MRRLSSAVFAASLLATGVGCSDDEESTPTPDSGARDAGTIDSGNTLLDASLDATTTDAGASPTVDVSSKAADLSVTINLLLGEHLILAAKATGAALNGATDEFNAYGALLNKNGTDLGDLVGSAYGDAAKSSFNAIWSAHNGFFVAYTQGVATNDTAKKDAAVNSLTTSYVPQFSGLIATATQLPLATVTTLVTEHVTTTKAIVDAQGAKDWPKAYAAIRTAFAHMKMLGDPLAVAVAKAKAADFPGNPASKAADFRVQLNLYLQEHLYLASFATDAALNGRTDEFNAAGAALNSNGTDIGKVVGTLFDAATETSFNSIWSAHNGFFVAYTQGVATADEAKKTTAVNSLTGTYVPQFSALLEAATGTPAATWTPGVTDHVLTTKAVVDAQNTLKTTPSAANATAVGAADHEAGQHMKMLGDPLAKGIVGKVPTKF
jgi:hypothetical protein